MLLQTAYRTAQRGQLHILRGQGNVRIRPIVCLAPVEGYFSALPNLLGAINGTFFAFDKPYRSPQHIGWILTDYELALNFPEREDRRLRRDGGADSYWWRANVVPESTEAGYRHRYGFFARGEHSEIRQGLPGENDYDQEPAESWLIGGGACLLREGEPACSTLACFGQVDEGHFTREQLYGAKHAVIACRRGELPELIVTEPIVGEKLPALLKAEGYWNAIMLDGGGAANLSFRTSTGINHIFRHGGRYTHLHNMVGILLDP